MAERSLEEDLGSLGTSGLSAAERARVAGSDRGAGGDAIAVTDSTVGHRHRWWILPVLSLSVVVVTLDNLVLQVALPTLSRDLGANASQLQWFADAYALVFASTLLFSGSLGDRFGHRRLLMAGLGLFGSASLAAAYASSSGQLIAARAVMAVGASLLMPATLSIVQQIFPAGERQRAVSIWAGAASIGVPIGPIVGGLLLDHFWWGSVFLINLPVVAVALTAGALLIPPSVRHRDAALDWPGTALVIAGLTLGVAGLIEAPRYGWASPTTIGLLIGAGMALTGFSAWQRHTPHPLLPPALLADRRFSITALAIVLMAFGLFGVLFILTQYLQVVRGLTPLQAGIHLMPIAAIAVGAGTGVIAARWVATRWILVVGIVVIAAGIAVMAGIGADDEPRAVYALIVMGIGLGSLGPASDLLLGAVPPDKAGIGSAMTDTTLQLGGSLGVAVLGSVFASGYVGRLLPTLDTLAHTTGQSATALSAAKDSLAATYALAERLGPAGPGLRRAGTDAFLHGAHASLAVAAAVALAGAVIAALALPTRSPQQHASTPAE